MSSISNPFPLPPQMSIKEGRLVLERAITSNGVVYDISISFKSNGTETLPPQAILQRPNLYKDIQSVAQRIISSLPSTIQTNNLEKIGFLIEEDDSSKVLKTAVLVADAQKSVLDSWKKSDLSVIRETENTRSIPLRSSGALHEDEKKIDTVDQGLKYVRSLFRAESVMSLPKNPEPDQPAPIDLPDLALSFDPVESTPSIQPPATVFEPSAKSRKIKKPPQYLLFADDEKGEKKLLLQNQWNSFLKENPWAAEVSWEQFLEGGKSLPEDQRKLFQQMFEKKQKNEYCPLDELYKKFEEISDRLFKKELEEISAGTILSWNPDAKNPGYSNILLKNQFLDELERRWFGFLDN